MGHIHGNSEYDFTVSAIIIHQEKVLLLFHHKLHMWLPPAGHIELNETPIEALYREVEEETGLTKDHLTLVLLTTENLAIESDKRENTILALPFNMNVHTVNDEGHRHIDLSYIFTSDTDNVTKEKNGAEKLEWFDLETLKTLSPMPKMTYGQAKYALDKVGELQK